MLRRPPRATRTDTRLPHATLFRSAAACNSSVDLPIPGSPPISVADPSTSPPPSARSSSAIPVASRSGSATRSEEHTSELVTNAHLVCRLLLEKNTNPQHLHKHLT